MIMGNPHSRPEDRLRFISREVNSLRSSLKTSRQNIKDKKDIIVEGLVRHSNEVSSMNGKVKQKNREEVLKKISETMEEVLKIEPSDLDRGAVESDSFVNLPLNQRRTDSVGSLRSSKKATREQTSTNRSSVPTLRDIETKVSELKAQITTAIDNKDSKQLRVYQQTIRVIADELVLIHAEKGTPLEQRKDGIDKKITSLYHKASRALNDLKKDDNLQHKSKQYRKDKAMSELAEIEVYLAENESLLDKLIKEKNSSEFAAIRNNIVANNQRLAKVDIVDTEVKEKVILLQQKLTETVNNLDRIMGKREFNSKFQKSLESFERVIRNFDANTNAEDTINYLQSLRNSVQNLEEINDASKNRKRELLQSINYQIGNFNDAIEKESDKKIIEKIVEDNVILRKNAKSSDKEYTVIDQFINHWTNVKSNFDVNSYSKLSLLRTDRVLEEMQQSINDIRVAIANKCDINPPSNLIKKHSQSVPKLNSRKSYGSNRSLDQIDDSKIIRTKAKVYNLSTPELQNVEKQQQNYVNNRFSKIEEIKLQVHYIKEKIDDTHNKNLLRDKLDHYHKNLKEFLNDSNKTVANNAALVSSEIVELLYKLVVADFKEQVEVLSKRVQNFTGTRYDKEFIDLNDDLLKIQLNLESFNIPSQYTSLFQEKGQLLDEVCNNIESLQKKGSNYMKHEDENVRKIKAKLTILGEQVKRFSGTYRGVVYNTIERELNKLLRHVGEQVEDKAWCDEITEETERLLQILKQRSSLAQSFRNAKPEDNKSEEQVGMSKIKRDLINIKREIDRTPDNNVDAFIGLQSRLGLVNFELSQIAARSNENLAKEKEIFSNEAETLKNVVDAKIALGQQPIVQWPERELQPASPKNDVNKEIEQFENTFKAIKKDITAPNNEQDVHKYYKLAQDIKNLIEKLSKYNFQRGSDLHTRQTSLLNEMQYYVEALEQGAIDADYVFSMERKLDIIENIVDNDQQYDLKTMAKELQTIQNKLQEHQFNTTDETLRSRKNSVQQKTDGLAQKLKQIENSETQTLIKYTKKLDEIEAKVKVVAPQITSFIGVKSDNKYYELNETTIRMILELDKFDTENEEVQKRRIKLLKDLHALGRVLDERALQTQEIVKLEQELGEVSSMLDNFSGKENDVLIIKSKMEAIKRELHGLKVNNDLISRKNACIETFSVLFNKTMLLSASPISSKGYPLQPSSNQIEHSSSGYSSRIYNFVTQTSKNIINSSDGNDETLAQINQEIKGLETAVKDSGDVNQLHAFDEALTKYTIQIENFKYTKDSPQYSKVYELYKQIQNLSDVIEGKIYELDLTGKIVHDVDVISNRFNTPLTYEEINRIDEHLIQLQIALGKIKSESLKPQIDGCMLRIILFLQKISEYKQSVQSTSV